MNGTANTPLLLTPAQAAKALSISERTLWTLTKSRVISHVRLGRCVRYSIDDLQQWINARKKGGAQ